MKPEANRPRGQSERELRLIQLDADRVVADVLLNQVEDAYAEMLDDRRTVHGLSSPVHETKRTHEGGVHSLIFRWADGGFSRNVEGMVRRDAESNELGFSVLVHAWPDKTVPTGERVGSALLPQDVAHIPIPLINRQVLKYVLLQAHTQVSTWQPPQISFKFSLDIYLSKSLPNTAKTPHLGYN